MRFSNEKRSLNLLIDSESAWKARDPRLSVQNSAHENASLF
jgi:hypothetical protein